ncbi:DUF4143 domain-containing protein [Rickettsia sibirica]|uniref:DUF4143 domain-containing protein n=1 Tax=Rickettsia sibirica TaxID=35793 RepID=UPI001ED982CD
MAYKYLNDKRDELFYWRTKEGYEVDFIFQNNDAFEVKIASSIQKNHLEDLLEFSKDSDFKLHRIILQDVDHSVTEKRYFCLGKVDGNI